MLKLTGEKCAGIFDIGRAFDALFARGAHAFAYRVHCAIDAHAAFNPLVASSNLAGPTKDDSPV